MSDPSTTTAATGRIADAMERWWDRQETADALPVECPHDFTVVPNHVVDRLGRVWAVVRDGGMLTRADYGGIESVGIKFAEQSWGPLLLVFARRSA